MESSVKTDAAAQGAFERSAMAVAWIAIAVLIAVVLVFASLRAATDLPLLLGAEHPDPDAFEARYVAAPWLAYLHIVPGVGTIRLWIGLFVSLTDITIVDTFALGFWLGLGTNVLLGELWLWWRGDPVSARTQGLS